MAAQNPRPTVPEKKRQSRLSRLLRQQFGGSDVEMVVFFVVFVTVASVIYLILGWIKSVKDERVLTNEQNYKEFQRRQHERPMQRGVPPDQLVF